MRRARSGWVPVGVLALLACAAAPSAMPDAPPEGAPAAGTRRQESLVPPGYGSLKQDEVTLAVRSDALLLKVTPLSEHVIRLLAPDTYARLHALAESRRADAAAASNGEVELFLVSFFSYQPNVEFQPEDVQLLHQGRVMRPVMVLPVTGGWGRQLLQQQETQAAVYAFEGPISYELLIRLTYAAQSSDAWENVIPRIRAERTKVQSRAGSEGR